MADEELAAEQPRQGHFPRAEEEARELQVPGLREHPHYPGLHGGLTRASASATN